ncbi:hypothetical protein LY78DRAFT_388146 [Colletotrichum sublineola]|nr:hypothetical protein LY78DRAFT_388146 [Colletotrichum sublineola]
MMITPGQKPRTDTQKLKNERAAPLALPFPSGGGCRVLRASKLCVYTCVYTCVYMFVRFYQDHAGQSVRGTIQRRMGGSLVVDVQQSSCTDEEDALRFSHPAACVSCFSANDSLDVTTWLAHHRQPEKSSQLQVAELANKGRAEFLLHDK